MYLLSIFGCLFNVFFIPLFARIITRRLLFLIVMFSLGMSFCASVVVFYEVIMLKTICLVPLADWLHASFLNISWCLLFDNLSVTLLFVVLFISLLVHLYSLGYMADDPHIVRFLFSLSLFTFFMLVMVTANNVLQLFLGWEGVGLSSYLLINFWYSRSEANKSAIKAIVVNRIGDFGLYLGILLIVFLFKSVNFGTIFATCYLYENATLGIFGYDFGLLTLIACCIFLGTMGKSAQIGLHMWLPDAMEGPTPVSALLHAATMVTAGVFILIRFAVVFEYVPKVLFFVTLIGSLTSLFAGLSALFQTDIKKIIAYSTCSHLGIMLIICGFSQYNAAVFHLLNHAFFKALLFLGVGSVIHALGDEQDFRKMGGLVTLLPLTYTMFFIGSLSLSGFPFLSGYFSKDLIWELIFTNFYSNMFINTIDPWLCSSGLSPFLYYKYMFFIFNLILALSVLYSFRLVMFVFFSDFSGFKSGIKEVHEPSLVMLIPLIVLALFSVFAGYLFKDLFIGLGMPIWSQQVNNLYYSSFKELLFNPEIFNWSRFFLKNFTFILSVVLFSLTVKYYFSNIVFVLDLFVWYVNTILLSVLFFIHYGFCYITSFFKKPLFVFVLRLVIYLILVSICIYFLFTVSLIVCVWLVFTVPMFHVGWSQFVNLPTFFLRCFHQRAYKRFVFRFLFSDHVLYKWLSRFFMSVSYHITFKSLDRGFLELVGPFGIAKTIASLFRNVGLRFSTHFFSSLFLIVLCLVLLVVMLLLSSFDDFIFLIFLILASGFLIK